jgi:hypothetical protein
MTGSVAGRDGACVKSHPFRRLKNLVREMANDLWYHQVRLVSPGRLFDVPYLQF